MVKISRHNSDDWCHVCGKRGNVQVDIFYPFNAEHPKMKGPENYIRICGLCLKSVRNIVEEIDGVTT